MKYKIEKVTFPTKQLETFAVRLNAFSADGWEYVETVISDYENTEELRLETRHVLLQKRVQK